VNTLHGIGTDVPWAIWVVVLPLLSGVVAFLHGRMAGWLGVIASGGTAVAACALAVQVADAGPQRHHLGGWGAPLGVNLQVDGLSAVMLLLTAAVGLTVSVHAAGALASEPPAPRAGNGVAPVEYYWPLWLLLWAGLNALFLSADLFNLYVTLEVVSLSAVALVAQAGSSLAVTAALRYLFAALIGSLLYLLAVSLLYATYGVLDVGLLGAVIVPGPATTLAIALAMLGLMLKTALFPLHFWLPAAHASAPAPVSAALSGLVVTASFYVCLRLWYDAFAPAVLPGMGSALAVLGAVAIVWGSLQALAAERVKMLVAYSTVAQLGYLFLVFALAPAEGPRAAAWHAGVLFAVSHGCAKAAMFLAAGSLYRAMGHDRIIDLSARGQYLPITFFAIGLAGVTLMGLPPSGTFVAKWILIDAAIQGGQVWLAVVIVGGGLLAGGYLLPLVGRAFTGTAPEIPESMGVVPASMRWSALVLAIVAAALGFASGPITGLLGVGAP
jgi:multicomponent Na+:H+ antiporter subunit D